MFGTRAGIDAFGVQLAPIAADPALAVEFAADSRLLHFLLMVERDAIRTQARLQPHYI